MEVLILNGLRKGGFCKVVTSVKRKVLVEF